MDRQFYLDLAARGLRMPIGTDLVLHEQPDPAAVLLDGTRLGQVYELCARRWNTPLAMALMDLTLEKDLILHRLKVPAEARESYHFSTALDAGEMAFFPGEPVANDTPRLRANLGAISYIRQQTDLVPVGMAIGPFSLMTKLVADPITPVFMAGAGTSAVQDPEVALVEQVLGLAERVVMESVIAQARAGAAAIMIAEPAANVAYFSPNQLAAGSDIYQRYVVQPNRRIAEKIRSLGMDLVFHCCGELIDNMVRDFASLDPVILSLGSSRKLWHDATLVPKNVVLYGNLPTKKFYSDESITESQVAEISCELLEQMRATGHPFILGSECDVLSVPGCRPAILRKVDAMLHACR